MRLQACHLLLVPLHLSSAAVFARENLRNRNAQLSSPDSICPEAVTTHTVTLREPCTAGLDRRQDDSGIPAGGFEGLRISLVTETVTRAEKPKTETVTKEAVTITETKEAVTVTETQAPKTVVQTVTMSNNASVVPPACSPVVPGIVAGGGGDSGVRIVPIAEANLPRTTLSFDPFATSSALAGVSPPPELPASTSVPPAASVPPVTVVPVPAAPEPVSQPAATPNAPPPAPPAEPIPSSSSQPPAEPSSAPPAEPPSSAPPAESTTAPASTTTSQPESATEAKGPVTSGPAASQAPEKGGSSGGAPKEEDTQKDGKKDGGVDSNRPDLSAPVDEANQGGAVSLPDINISTFSLESELNLGGLVVRTAGPEPSPA